MTNDHSKIKFYSCISLDRKENPSATSALEGALITAAKIISKVSVKKEEPALTDFICTSIISKKNAETIVNDVRVVLDNEADVSVVFCFAFYSSRKTNWEKGNSLTYVCVFFCYYMYKIKQKMIAVKHEQIQRENIYQS